MPYTYQRTGDTPLTIDFEGDHVVLNPGEQYPGLDACKLIRFINAVHAQEGSGVVDKTAEGLDTVQQQCVAMGGGEGGVVPPPAEPPTPNPSQTDSNNPQPHESENAQNLGAPNPKPGGDVNSEQRQPGQSDGRTLTQQYYDPQNPMPDYDIRDQLQLQGIPPDQLDDEFQKILHNDPPFGLPHPDFGLNDRVNPSASGADPVDLSTGEFTLRVSDLQIPSRGMPLHLTRLYHSGAVSFGPWGYNWDHNYNVYLRVLIDGSAAVWTGELREDIFTVAPGGFEAPIGLFRKLTHHPAGPGNERWELTNREGVRLIFERPAGWPRPDRFPLARIVDRRDNTHLLTYDAEGRLAQVEDQSGRHIRFDYGDCGLVERVSDHTGRAWNYAHDGDIEHLISVVTPPTPEYPDGVTTQYEYDRFQSHPALIHNIVRVFDGSGREIVRNEYAIDPISDDFGRVVYQEFGGFESTLKATRLQYVPRLPDAVNVAALRVESVDPGVLRVYTFNYRGDLLDERFRLVYDGTYRLFARIYRYDDQGNLIERRDPNGLGMLYLWDKDNQDPRARGNLIKAELVSSPLFAEPSRIMQMFTYEPNFHRPKTLRDEAGFLTTWVYDYEELAGMAGDVIRIEYPDATLPDGLQQSRQERFQYTAEGQLAEHVTGTGIRHVFSYYNAGPSSGYLQSVTWDADGAAELQTIEYDTRGHRSALVDGLGNRIEIDTNALDLVTGMRRPAIKGSVAEAWFFHTPDGQVRREEFPRGTYSDAVITDPVIAHEYEYDVFGRLIKATYGINTATPHIREFFRDGEGRIVKMRDALDRITLVCFDERGRVLSRTEAAALPEEAAWTFTYDVNGNQSSVVDPAGHRIDYTIDAWDRVSALTLHGAPDVERTRIRFTLNRFDRPDRIHITGLVSPGVVGTLLDQTADYDERGRVWRRSLDQRVTTFTRDADDRVVLQTDQRGTQVRLAYNGLGRVIRSDDAIGNFEIRVYDSAGNLVSWESHETLPEGGTEVFTTTIKYDARNQPIRLSDPLGNVFETSYDDRGFAFQDSDALGRIVQRTFGLLGELTSVTEMESPGVPLTHLFAHDLGGRQISATDPDGNSTAYSFDARDRRTSITYPDGRVHRFFYDQRQQVASELTPGGTAKTYTYGADAGLTTIDFTPGPGVATTPSLQLSCDGLRRVVRMQQGGVTLERVYDASLRLRSETIDGQTTSMAYDDVAGTADLTYADGRIDRLTFDVLGRPVSISFLQAGGSGLTAAIATGTELARYTWRGVDRVARRDLHNGFITEIEYDAGGRLVSIEHRDAANARVVAFHYVFDAAGRRRIVWVDPLPHRPARFDLDGLSRLRFAALDPALTEPAVSLDQAAADALIAAAEAAPSATSEKYSLNGADARQQTVRSGPVASIDTFTLTPSSQITQVIRTGAGAGVFPFTFDGDGRCTQDDRYGYLWNAMGQLLEVRTLPTFATIMKQSFDPAGRVLRRTENNDTYRQAFIGNRLLERQMDNGQSLVQFTLGAGVDEVILESNGANHYPLQDASSTVVANADDANVIERYSYAPFGGALIWAPDGVTARSISTIGGIPRFAGHLLLSSGLYDARARVYDPQLGRFLQPDPFGYVNSDCLYTYAHHSPVDFVDPTGEVALLVGLLAAAAVGLVVGGGLNATRQAIQIHERHGTRSDFSWGELGFSAGAGAVMGLVMVVAPEVGVGLAAYGVYQGGTEIAERQYETGVFDITTSLLPFAFKGVRSATFGEGSAFAPVRGLGPSATLSARFARIPELGRATNDLAGRLWNERLYHGTDMQSAQRATTNIGLHLRNSRFLQTLPGTRRLGPGLYFGRVPGDPTVHGTPAWWANNSIRSGEGALLEASIPRWKFFLLKREPGVLVDVPQDPFPHPDTRQTFFPFDGPLDPVSGPAVKLGGVARWRIFDPNAVQPSLSGLYPPLMVRPPIWPADPTDRSPSK